MKHRCIANPEMDLEEDTAKICRDKNCQWLKEVEAESQDDK
jgi:hypothetical protein